MEENSFKCILYSSINNFLAIFIFALFGLIVLSVGFLSYTGTIGPTATIYEKTLLVFEGILGIIIGFYFGHRGVDRAEKETKIAKKEKEDAIIEKEKAKLRQKEYKEGRISEEEIVNTFQKKYNDYFNKKEWKNYVEKVGIQLDKDQDYYNNFEKEIDRKLREQRPEVAEDVEVPDFIPPGER